MSEDNKWHFRKTIDAGHLTTTIALTLGAFWYFADLDKRIALLEAPQEEIRTDLKEIKTLLGPLPMFIELKERTDREQDKKIQALEKKT
tara:strand:+ start:61 stop:327 length:267 start_codon:yes stop_codon:yes gene_type:complete